MGTYVYMQEASLVAIHLQSFQHPTMLSSSVIVLTFKYVNKDKISTMFIRSCMISEYISLDQTPFCNMSSEMLQSLQEFEFRMGPISAWSPGLSSYLIKSRLPGPRWR